MSPALVLALSFLIVVVGITWTTARILRGRTRAAKLATATVLLLILGYPLYIAGLVGGGLAYDHYERFRSCREGLSLAGRASEIAGSRNSTLRSEWDALDSDLRRAAKGSPHGYEDRHIFTVWDAAVTTADSVDEAFSKNNSQEARSRMTTVSTTLKRFDSQC